MTDYSGTELAEWAGGRWDAQTPGQVTGISNDTRTMSAGAVYVALKGDRFDGHDYVGDAMRKGASGAIVDATWQPPEGVSGSLLRVADTRAALADMAIGYRTKLGVQVVGITGSVGKSSVKELLAQILAEALPTAKTHGNWNNDIGLPLSMLAMDGATQIGVFEVATNHPGEIAPLAAVAGSSVGLVTNVGPAHIEFFGSVEAIAEEKADLLRSLPRDGLAVLNEDGGGIDILRNASTAPVVTVSRCSEADYRCREWQPELRRAVITEKATAEDIAISLPLPGSHVVSNAMLAIAVARHFGIGWDGVRAGLESFRPLPMRWQVERIGDVTVINDAYNANPVSVRAAIGTLQAEVDAPRKWLVLGDMLELGEHANAEHTALGRDVGGGQWHCLVTVGELGELIAQGAQAAGMDSGAIVRCSDAGAAASFLVENLEAGDVVLLKASRRIGLENVVTAIQSHERSR